MPTTLLAVDDSVTMRKVLEMTFAGEDFRVVTADTTDAALAKVRADRPAIVLCDVTIDGAGGYGLCARIKAESPAVAVVLLASKQQPYDNQKGLSARADDFIEKPFDTQLLIDKVKKLATRLAVEPARAPLAGGPVTQPGIQPGTPAFAGGPSRAAPMGQPVPVRPPSAVPGPMTPSPRPPAVGAAVPVGRGTLAYGGYTAPPVAPTPNAGTAPPARPAPSRTAPPVAYGQPNAPRASAEAHTAVTAPPAATSPSPPPAMSASTNGQLATKLANLGLTEMQVTAVLALSREVIEKAVWEVVPVLAETMIKEEIKRLTSA